MNNGLFTYLAALLLFGSNGIIAAAIALPSSDIVLLRTFLGALSLVTILAITQRHKLQAPSRPREAAALLLSGTALGASWIFLFRAYQTIGVGVSSLLYYCGPIIVMALSPLIFGEKLTGSKKNTVLRLIIGFWLILAFLPLRDALGQMSIISDEETEQYLAKVIRPIFQTAGIPFNRNKIYIVNDNSLNAFVGDGNNLFIQSISLIYRDTANLFLPGTGTGG